MHFENRAIARLVGPLVERSRTRA
uniref:Uncharacterized protein n=1 Tax=Arundo donax TaxID=35708 RepID=A0A0A9SYY5_ARUDO